MSPMPECQKVQAGRDDSIFDVRRFFRILRLTFFLFFNLTSVITLRVGLYESEAIEFARMMIMTLIVMRRDAVAHDVRAGGEERPV